MKAVTVKTIKDELSYKNSKELVELCLRLSKFKKENKELLTYVLFESSDEEAYIESVKEQIDELFDQININSYFYIRKSTRKILTLTKKFIRYSQRKETEVELLLYFCKKLKNFKPSIHNSVRLQNIYVKQISSIQKIVKTLHEDLQFDYQIDLKDLLED